MADSQKKIEKLLSKKDRVRIISPGVESDSPTLAEQVKGLEERAKKLDELCGEMHATLEVNLHRGHLRSDDDAQLERIIQDWKTRRANA